MMLLPNRTLILLLLLTLVAMMLPEIAFADIVGGAGGNPGAAGGNTNGIAKSLCNIVSMVTGPAGRAIASLAVIVVGVSALLGRVQWNQALVVCVGIAIIFGAQPLLEAMTANAVNSADLSAASCKRLAPNPPAPLLDGPLAQTLCNIVSFFGGQVGKAIATIGVIIMGIMALIGKLSPPYALIVVTGIALIFGSATIVKELAPQGTFDDDGHMQLGPHSSCRALVFV